jgi:hypothetical protein
MIMQLSILDVVEKIKTLNLPIVPCRSKSGGIHLFLFLSDFVPAVIMQKKLKELASVLGYGNSEIFPKQTHLLKERGDVGQWINMPYFAGIDTTSYAWLPGGKRLNTSEFVAHANKMMVKSDELDKMVWSEEILPQGPPCLQVLIKQGFPEGTRNQGLFAMGVYAQKANPDGWREMVEDYNLKYMKPPLDAKEVLLIIGSLGKKEYNYACKKQPICDFCNAALCRSRKYGVGTGAGMPVLGSLTKMASDPPIWFIDIEDGGRLELTTEELQSPRLFQRVCMSKLNIMPWVLKAETWQPIIAELLSNVTVLPVPVESTPIGQLLQHLDEFVTHRPATDDAEGLCRGNVYARDGWIYFRLIDFTSFLDRKRFLLFRTHQIHAIFRDNEISNQQVPVGKHSVATYRIRAKDAIVKDYTPPKPGQIPY